MSIKRFTKPAFFLFLSLLIHILLIGLFTIDPLGLVNYFYNKRYPAPERKPPIIVDIIDLKEPDLKPPVLEKPSEDAFASTRDQTVIEESSPDPTPKTTEPTPPKKKRKFNQPADTDIIKDKSAVMETTDSQETQINLMPTKKDITKVIREESRRQLAKTPYKQFVKNKPRSTTLNLNTSDLRYAEYMLALKRRVELFWSYPTASVMRAEQGRLKIDFTISGDGTIKDIKLIKSSNYPALDDAAITALRLASPFQTIPKNFDLNHIDINANFEYNLIYR